MLPLISCKISTTDSFCFCLIPHRLNMALLIQWDPGCGQAHSICRLIMHSQSWGLFWKIFFLGSITVWFDGSISWRVTDFEQPLLATWNLSIWNHNNNRSLWNSRCNNSVAVALLRESDGVVTMANAMSGLLVLNFTKCLIVMYQWLLVILFDLSSSSIIT